MDSEDIGLSIGALLFIGIIITCGVVYQWRDEVEHPLTQEPSLV